MDTKDWGNNSPERQSLRNDQPSSLNYTKLFWTIVGAIITASAIMSVIGFLFMAVAASAFFSAFSQPVKQSVTSHSQQQTVTRQVSTPVQQYSNFQRQNQELTQEASRASREKAAAQRQNRQTCQFWRDQYQKDKLERSKSYRDSACARANTP